MIVVWVLLALVWIAGIAVAQVKISERPPFTTNPILRGVLAGGGLFVSMLPGVSLMVVGASMPPYVVPVFLIMWAILMGGGGAVVGYGVALDTRRRTRGTPVPVAVSWLKAVVTHPFLVTTIVGLMGYAVVSVWIGFETLEHMNVRAMLRWPWAYWLVGFADLLVFGLAMTLTWMSVGFVVRHTERTWQGQIARAVDWPAAILSGGIVGLTCFWALSSCAVFIELGTPALWDQQGGQALLDKAQIVEGIVAAAVGWVFALALLRRFGPRGTPASDVAA